MTAPDLIGFIGESAVLATCFLVQAERMDPRALSDPEHARQRAHRLFASVRVQSSGADHPGALVAISAYGLIRSLLPRNGGKARRER
jgi:hypothetical protein